MSLFSFLNEAGESITDFITGNGKTEDAIANRINQLGLAIENLDVDVKGDTATLRGEAQSRDAFEKAILAAGNIKGIAQVKAELTIAEAHANDDLTGSEGQDEIASTPQEYRPVFYQVERGDTLSAIAKKFYGSANRYTEIFEANRPMLSDPDKIYPGQTLRIPGAEKFQRAA